MIENSMPEEGYDRRLIAARKGTRRKPEMVDEESVQTNMTRLNVMNRVRAHTKEARRCVLVDGRKLWKSVHSIVKEAPRERPTETGGMMECKRPCVEARADPGEAGSCSAQGPA